eukprot:g16349.t1
MIIRSDIVDQAVLDKASKMKIVVRAGAGYDNIDLKACEAKSITAMNTPGQNANAVAELVFGSLGQQEDFGLVGGDLLHATVRQARLVSTRQSYAFALMRGDGSVVSWGSRRLGGDSSRVQQELRDVEQIQASGGAFAAIRADGQVITWGDSSMGGKTGWLENAVRESQIVHPYLHTPRGGFAALRMDGTVESWGRQIGGNCLPMQLSQLKKVKSLCASDYAFAALKEDGTVVTWGNAASGGDSSWVKEQLHPLFRWRKLAPKRGGLGWFHDSMVVFVVVFWGLSI